MSIAVISILLTADTSSGVSVTSTNNQGQVTESTIIIDFGDDSIISCPPICSDEQDFLYAELVKLIQDQNISESEKDSQIQDLLTAIDGINTNEIIITESQVSDDFLSGLFSSTDNELQLIVTKIDSTGKSDIIVGKQELTSFSFIQDIATGSNFDVGSLNVNLLVNTIISDSVKSVNGNLITYINDEPFITSGFSNDSENIDGTVFIKLNQPSSILFSLDNSVTQFSNGENIISYSVRDFSLIFDNDSKLEINGTVELASLSIVYNRPLHDILVQQEIDLAVLQSSGNVLAQQQAIIEIAKTTATAEAQGKVIFYESEIKRVDGLLQKIADAEQLGQDGSRESQALYDAMIQIGKDYNRMMSDCNNRYTDEFESNQACYDHVFSVIEPRRKSAPSQGAIEAPAIQAWKLHTSLTSDGQLPKLQEERAGLVIQLGLANGNVTALSASLSVLSLTDKSIVTSPFSLYDIKSTAINNQDIDANICTDIVTYTSLTVNRVNNCEIN